MRKELETALGQSRIFHYENITFYGAPCEMSEIQVCLRLHPIPSPSPKERKADLCIRFPIIKFYVEFYVWTYIPLSLLSCFVG